MFLDAPLPEPEPPLRDDEPDVIVHRSLLPDADGTWFLWAADTMTDLTDFAHPGGLRAVKRYAVAQYARGGDRARVHWTRETPDAYRLRLRPEREG